MYNLLLKRHLKDKHRGAILPSSKMIVQKTIEKIDFQKAMIIIEYCPGQGVITKKLLENMLADASLFVFETNEHFINDLLQLKDKRLIIINSEAENAQIILKNRYKVEQADYIISTVPFTLYNRHKRKRIIYKSYALLRGNGKFITSQYSWLIYNLIKKKYAEATLTARLLNFPPAFIIEGIK